MSSGQDSLNASGHLTSWMEEVNPDVETMGLGRAGWGRIELDLIGGLATGRVIFVMFGLYHLTKV